MNKERIKQLRDHLAGLKPAKFDLSVWFGNDAGYGIEYQLRESGKTNAQALEGSCGTTACIAGHALALLNPNGMVPRDPEDDAAALLELTPGEARVLFVPDGVSITDLDEVVEMTHPDDLPFPMGREDVRLDQAIQVLDHLLTTGQIDWQILDQPGVATAHGNGGSITFSVHTGRIIQFKNSPGVHAGYEDIRKVDVKDLWDTFGDPTNRSFDVLDLRYWDEEGNVTEPERDRPH